MIRRAHRPPRTAAWPRRKRRRAALLVLTLWLVLVLAVLANSLAFEMQVETRLTGAFRDQFRAEELARAGVARALTDLRNDRLLERVEQMPTLKADGTANEPQPFDAYGDVWAGGTLAPRTFDVRRHSSGGEGSERSAQEGYYDLMVVDEESKLPLAAGGGRVIDALRYLLMELEVPEDKARDIANAIMDWQDADDVPLAAGQGESERLAYQRLEESAGKGGRIRISGSEQPAADRLKAKEEHATPKNALFRSVEELLQVPGVTPKLFYGYDPEKELEPDFFPARSMGGSERRPVGLRDLVSVRAKSLNINTACLESLAAAFAASAGDLQKGRDAASKVIAYRQGQSRDKIDNRNAFRDMAKLQEADLDPALAKSLSASVPLTLTSDSFTIYCRATVGRKREVVRGSASRDESERAAPTARVIAACDRQLLVYPIQTNEDGTEQAPAEEMPGYRAPYNGPRQGVSAGRSLRTAASTIGKATAGAWFVPVVYFKSWLSD